MSSRIEWTDETWNPVTGCSKISPGCLNCYAERQASRKLHPYDSGLPWSVTNAEKNITLHEDRLELPARWERPRRIFVCSISDLFHEQIPVEFIARVWGRMAAEARHTFQVLTKRPARARELLTDPDFKAEVESEFACNTFGVVYPLKWPLPNIWIGVSAENQRRYDERWPELELTPAAIRFVSFEPLLGAVNIDRGGLDWAIVGGESGPRARPMDPRWARSIRDQCKGAGVPFFFKQWGEWKPVGTWDRVPEFERTGKKKAGRELDGVLHDASPRISTPALEDLCARHDLGREFSPCSCRSKA